MKCKLESGNTIGIERATNSMALNMEVFVQELTLAKPVETKSEMLEIAKLKDEITQLIDEMKPMVQDMTKNVKRVRCTQTQLGNQLDRLHLTSQQKVFSTDLTNLEIKVKLLSRATGVKFHSANSGVLMHKAKVCSFTIPKTQSKQVTIDSMWKYLEKP
ncbi:uncharacterized protein [Watersipora subatra]|uniref:uncharacterized protein n=1 Tax=Watersipora subatra TaxID=2589382 RepID=UPI00355B8117